METSKNNRIYFYLTSDKYGSFSNFSRHQVLVDGRSWRTSEHFFQAQKFKGTQHELEIMNAATPKMAAEMGRERHRPLRKDWETIKNDVMREVIFCKFTQNKSLKLELLSTNNAILIEHTSNDFYWADGGDGSGQNWLGRILMEVREAIKENKTYENGHFVSADRS